MKRQPIDDWSYYLLQIEQNLKNINKLLTDSPPQGKIKPKDKEQLNDKLVQTVYALGHLMVWVNKN